jgi:hypothetical protein
MCVFLGSLVTIVAGRLRSRQIAHAMVLLAGFLLLALNQHRFQPWLYQLLLFSCVFLLSGVTRLTRQLLTWFVISIYVYSALGKFDYEFLHTVGPLLVDGMLRLVNLGNGPVAATPPGLVMVLPGIELLIGLALAYPPSRRLAGVMASGFHLALIWVLGPTGLNHSLGVVLWNFQFAVQAILLFVLLEQPQGQARVVAEAGSVNQSWSRAGAVLVIGMAVALPLVERWGYWDHWPSWALYAPHSSRCEAWVSHRAIDRLPQSLQQEIVYPDVPTLWVRLPLDRWALVETGAPIYPQARFQLGVCRSLAQRIDSPFQVKAVLRGPANRLNGRRWSRDLLGTQAIEQAGTDFLFNTQPRKLD